MNTTTVDVRRTVVTAAPTRLGDWIAYLAPVGRALFALIFIVSAPHHFTSESAAYAASQGVPVPTLLVPLSGLMALVGGISVLLGYKTRAGAALLAAFLIPVTLMMHAFWRVADPMDAQMQLVMFLKNVALLGGAAFIACFGAGPFSLDARARRQR